MSGWRFRSVFEGFANISKGCEQCLIPAHRLQDCRVCKTLDGRFVIGYYNKKIYRTIEVNSIRDGILSAQTLGFTHVWLGDVTQMEPETIETVVMALDM